MIIYLFVLCGSVVNYHILNLACLQELLLGFCLKDFGCVLLSVSSLRSN